MERTPVHNRAVGQIATQEGPWWEEVAELRERIERRKALQGSGEARRSRTTVTLSPTVVELQEAELRASQLAAWRRRAPTLAERFGRKPDRIAAWAVALGLLMVAAGIIGGH